MKTHSNINLKPRGSKLSGSLSNFTKSNKPGIFRLLATDFSSKSGQALAEFVVGLIALLALAACLRIGATMITAHSDAMAQARKEAAMAAFPDADILSSAKYIHEVTAGSDKSQYTKDDKYTLANGIEFNNTIVEKAATSPSDWTGILDLTPGGRLSKLHGTAIPSSSFGLVKGTDTRTVPIDKVPATRLFYDASSIDVECNVWMTQLNGIY